MKKDDIKKLAKKELKKLIGSSKLLTNFSVKGSYIAFSSKREFSWGEANYEYALNPQMKVYLDSATSRVADITSRAKTIASNAKGIVNFAAPGLVVMVSDIVSDLYSHYATSIDKVVFNLDDKGESLLNIEACLYNTPREDFIYEVENSIKLYDKNKESADNFEKGLKKKFLYFSRLELILSVLNRGLSLLIALGLMIISLYNIATWVVLVIGGGVVLSLAALNYVHFTKVQSREGKEFDTLKGSNAIALLGKVEASLRYKRRHFWVCSTTAASIKEDERLIRQLKQWHGYINYKGNADDFFNEMKEKYGEPKGRILPIIQTYIDLKNEIKALADENDGELSEDEKLEKIEQMVNDQGAIIKILAQTNFGEMSTSILANVLKKYSPDALLWAEFKSLLKRVIFARVPLIKDVGKLSMVLALSVVMLAAPYLAGHYFLFKLVILFMASRIMIAEPLSKWIYTKGDNIICELSKNTRLKPITALFLDDKKLEAYECKSLKPYIAACHKMSNLADNDLSNFLDQNEKDKDIFPKPR